MDAVQAAPELTQNPTEVLKASSFDDLLTPIPNAAHLAGPRRAGAGPEDRRRTFPDHVGGASAPVGAAGVSLCSEITLKADAELPAFMYSLTSLKN